MFRWDVTRANGPIPFMPNVAHAKDDPQYQTANPICFESERQVVYPPIPGLWYGLFIDIIEPSRTVNWLRYPCVRSSSLSLTDPPWRRIPRLVTVLLRCPLCDASRPILLPLCSQPKILLVLPSPDEECVGRSLIVEGVAVCWAQQRQDRSFSLFPVQGSKMCTQAIEAYQTDHVSL